MKLKHTLILQTLVIAAFVLSAMSALVTELTFTRALNNEAMHMGKRLTDVSLGVEAACAGYAIDGRTAGEAEIREIAAQYGATIRRAENGPSTETGYVCREGDRLVSICAIEYDGIKYEIGLTGDLTEVLSESRALLIRCAGVSLIGLSLFAACMGAVSKRLLRPLDALTQTSRTLAAGELTARVRVESEDEIGALSTHFNDMAEALEASVARRDALIQNLTHEMKTPVAAIMGHADLIRRGGCEEAETLMSAHTIYKEAARLDALSRTMMRWILLERDEIDARPVSVRALFDEIQKMYEERMRANGEQVDMHISAGDEIISADRNLMQILLQNLVENARHAGAKQIALSAEKRGECEEEKTDSPKPRVWLTVRDDGCGMDAETVRRAAEPFYRADRARSRAHGGAGLGLALCHRIAQAHGACLCITSRPGEGTVVSVGFPGEEER